MCIICTAALQRRRCTRDKRYMMNTDIGDQSAQPLAQYRQLSWQPWAQQLHWRSPQTVHWHEQTCSALTTSLASAFQEQRSGPVQANLTICGYSSHIWSGWPALDQTTVPGMQILVKLLVHCCCGGDGGGCMLMRKLGLSQTVPADSWDVVCWWPMHS